MHYSTSRGKTLKSFYVYDGNVLQMWTDMSVFEKSARKAQLLMNVMDHIIITVSVYESSERHLSHINSFFSADAAKNLLMYDKDCRSLLRRSSIRNFGR